MFIPMAERNTTFLVGDQHVAVKEISVRPPHVVSRKLDPA
jgi:hypothetical protein